ncbi:hypothetical protein OQH61_03650 [Helicobacter sp. MIT 21-1697]|uniref:hypothetical protein n=1 Tax=Helicobacter sp. MIT 21-1697 TaxID=2993733 RepID=UPI00224A86A4|nr:hypothetical protein [Helicobacter sp. MIT 21-1697]MCX2716829.1 hypothetical protein [Helicobacter sp. MIT 21-1697]
MKNLTLRQSSILLIENFVNKYFQFKDEAQRQQTIQESIQIAQALIQDVSNDSALSIDELKDEAIEKIRGELATKDFVRAEIAEAKQELKLEMAKLRQELKLEIAEVRQELKLEIAEVKSSMIKWVVGVGVSAALLSVSANATLIMFLLQQLKP